LAHQGGGALPIVYPPHPIAKFNMLHFATVKKHVKLIKNDLPNLRIMQQADRAKQAQRNADIAAGCPVSPFPERVYMSPAEARKFSHANRERKSW
jgi:hypothetical protein